MRYSGTAIKGKRHKFTYIITVLFAWLKNAAFRNSTVFKALGCLGNH